MGWLDYKRRQVQKMAIHWVQCITLHAVGIDITTISNLQLAHPTPPRTI